MLTSHIARLAIAGLVALPSSGFSQQRVTADSSVASIMASSRRSGGLHSDVVLDVLRQRRGAIGVDKRREMGDSLAERVVSDKARTPVSADALFAIAYAGYPAGERPGMPDPEALDRLIAVDKRLGGVMRTTILYHLVRQDHPGRALAYIRSLAVTAMDVEAMTAVSDIMVVAGARDAADRDEAMRHLREMWDGDLVQFAPARNVMACFAERAGWPMKKLRCYRGTRR